MTVNKEPSKNREETIIRYLPMAKSFARQYAGRGAELEDLEQEAALRLCRLIDRWTGEQPDQSLTIYLWNRLRWAVRDAAAKMRRSSEHDSLDSLCEDDENFDIPSRENYTREDMLGVLTPEERALALALEIGINQAEFAAQADLSQQAVSTRLLSIRIKLSAYAAGNPAALRQKQLRFLIFRDNLPTPPDTA